MNTGYWKESEVKPDFKTWLDFYEGCIMCGCDHGCNQWIKEQEARNALAIRMLQLGSKNLDKLVTIPLERANKIWFWIRHQDIRRFNEKLRKQEL